MINDDPYMSLRQAIKEASQYFGNPIMYRTDVPGYAETVSLNSMIHRLGNFRVAGPNKTDVYPYDWSTEVRFFSILHDPKSPILRNRPTVLFEKWVIGEKSLTKLHLDFIDAGVKAPIYLRGVGPKSHLIETPFLGVSLFTDADAVMVAGLTSV